jgi:hypothetical protein
MSGRPWFDALLGKIADTGVELELRGLLNFVGFTFTELNDTDGTPLGWTVTAPTGGGGGGGGTGATEWAAYTPTITDANPTPVVVGDGGGVTAVWRQVGPDTIEMQINVNCGSTGFDFGTGALQFGLPPGLTVDATKTANGVFNGSVYLHDGSTQANNRGGRVIGSNGDDFVQIGPTGTASLLQSNVPFTWTDGDTIDFTAVVPVTGLT